ncbi:MAG TPA: CcmD family protein [Candidatus Kapabacteria bacterium]|nr:CcmD family protein [Candidatus Kapabacteria bacterium]
MEFLADNSMYVTLIIASLILVGLLLYLVRIDARLRKLERER